MTRYISNPENLKLMMTMLRDRSRNIQFEAFHVFKVSRDGIIMCGEKHAMKGSASEGERFRTDHKPFWYTLYIEMTS